MAFQSVAELLEAASHLEEGDRFSDEYARVPAAIGEVTFTCQK